MFTVLSLRKLPQNVPALCLLALACFGMATSGTLLAAGPDDQVDAHLAAGEFAAAVQLANAVQAPAQRDALLNRIAQAQDQAGARRAADQTLSSIRDDRVRSGALDHILAQRFGSGSNVGGIGQRGGGSAADFDSIIELVQSTIEPDSWDEVGGPGSIAPFEGGVVVDATGVLRKMKFDDAGDELRQLRSGALQSSGSRQSVRKSSKLRKVSLTRLEKAIQLRHAVGRRPSDEMRVLAGLTKIQYVMVYPETGDLVIAGPAGPWQRNREGRLVNVDSGRPVLHLDDCVAILRALSGSDSARFGCSITPRKENLARTKAFVAESAKKPLRPGRAAREKWLEEIRAAMGRQDIEVYGIDPGTRVAQVLVEADYRMKLVGMGLEEGTDGVSSYLDSIKQGEAPPPLDVLRWWFTLNYDALRTTSQRDVFEFRGQGVQVLSENEMLTQMGERIHTGKSDDLNRAFAGSFTREFPALAAKYPVYTELQNVFDLALLAALCRSEDLPRRIGWHMSTFMDNSKYEVPLNEPALEVDSVINHRVIGGKQIVAGVSGGVRVDPARYVVRGAIKTADAARIASERNHSKPVPDERWWWD